MACWSCCNNAARTIELEVQEIDVLEDDQPRIQRQLCSHLPLEKDSRKALDFEDDSCEEQPRLPSLLRNRLEHHAAPKKSHLGSHRMPWRARSHMWYEQQQQHQQFESKCEQLDPCCDHFSDCSSDQCSSVASSVSDDLLAAVRSFRTLEAGEMLQQLESDGTDVSRSLSRAEVERIRRVCRRWQEQIELKQLSWPISGNNRNLDVQWGFRLEHGLVHATFSTELEAGIGVARAVAALCELQLYEGFNEDFVSAVPLEENQAPNDCTWRLMTHNKLLNIRNDNIWQVSVTDALEAEGVIIIDLSIPDKEVQRVGGVQIPPPKDGFSRISYGHSTYSLQPLAGRGNGSFCAFRLVNQAVTQPSNTNYNLLSMLPSFARTRALRNGMEGTVEGLKRHMASSQKLEEALKSSPRAPLYEALQKHLEQWVGDPSRKEFA